MKVFKDFADDMLIFKYDKHKTMYKKVDDKSYKLLCWLTTQ